MRRMLTNLTVAFAVIAAALGAPFSQVAAQSGTPAATYAEANEALVRHFFDIAATGDLAALNDLATPDFVIRTAPPGEGSSLESLTQTLEAARAGLPDFTFRVDDIIAEGDLVVARTAITGTHLRDFFGNPPSGKRLEIAAIDIFRVEDGKIAENWHLEDILGVMEQLGQVPSAAATPASGSTPVAAEPETGMRTVDAATVEANRTLARRFRDEIFAQGNLTAADEILAPDVVWHADVAPGAEGVRAHATELRDAFPDLALSADQVVAAGDRVAILWTMRGTHQGELYGAPPTGNPVTTPGTDIFRIENGKIAEIWTVGDDLGLLIQLGALPPFGGEPAASPEA